MLDRLDFRENGRQWPFLFLTREQDLNRVIMEHVPARGYWSIDVVKSPVIEFTQSLFSENGIDAGRAYYVNGYYDKDNLWIRKSDDFLTWAKSVFSTTKRILKRRNPDYLGPNAEQWLASGGKIISPYSSPQQKTGNNKG